MQNTKKVFYLSFFFFLFTMALICLHIKPVFAVGIEVYEDKFFVDGASIRLKTDIEDETGDGIRFCIRIDKELFCTLSQSKDFKTGIIMIPQRLTDGEISLNTSLISDTDTTDKWQICEDASEYLQANVYLWNIPEEDYNCEITVRGYIRINGETFYTQQISRSLSYVAKVAADDMENDLSQEMREYLKETYLRKYTVSFDGEKKQSICYGEKIVPPETPVREGYDFDGWWNSDFTQKWDFQSDTIKGDTELFSKWKEQYIEISTVEQYIALTLSEDANAMSKNYRVTNDLDFSEKRVQFALGSKSETAFTGTFDGAGHKFYNFAFDSDKLGMSGLIWQIGKGGKLCNLGIETVENGIQTGNNGAGITAKNYGIIENSYIIGKVFCTSNYSAGMVFENYGIVKNCYLSIEFSSLKNSAAYLCQNNNADALIENVFINSCYGATNFIGYKQHGSVINSGLKTDEEMKRADTYNNWDKTFWNVEDGMLPTLKK